MAECKCGNKQLIKSGKQVSRKGVRQRWKCNQCGRIIFGDFIEKAVQNGVQAEARS